MYPNSFGASVSPCHRSDRLFQGPAHEITQRVRGGQADIAHHVAPAEGPGFVWHRLYVEQLCLAVPRGHRLAGRARVRLSAAAGEPVVALGEQSGLRQLTDELWAGENIHPDIVFEASEIPTVEGLVAAGFGVAVVPVPRDGGDSRRSTFRSPTREPNARWGWCGTGTEHCRRRQSALRTSQRVMRKRMKMTIESCIGHIRGGLLTSTRCRSNSQLRRSGPDMPAVRPHTVGCSPRCSALAWRHSLSSIRRRPSFR